MNSKKVDYWSGLVLSMVSLSYFQPWPPSHPQIWALRLHFEAMRLFLSLVFRGSWSDKIFYEWLKSQDKTISSPSLTSLLGNWHAISPDKAKMSKSQACVYSTYATTKILHLGRFEQRLQRFWGQICQQGDRFLDSPLWVKDKFWEKRL